MIIAQIKNLYHEPLVISLLAKGFGGSVQNRLMLQLLVGDCIEVEYSSVSPELISMAKKGRVQIVKITTEVVPTVEPEKIDTPHDDPSSVSAESDDVEEQFNKELERELLE